MSASAARKPWPMRWIVAAILLFIVPYTYVNLKFRKPGKAFEPYADMKAQANVNRLLEAGYRRVAVRAERPFPALTPAEITRGPAAVPAAVPGGLPADLAATLVDPPRLPAAYRDLLAPGDSPVLLPARLQFTARLESDREQLAGADIYLRENELVIVPSFEPVPEGLQARSAESTVLLTLPAGLLPPGRHALTLLGSRESLRWETVAR
jgi:hypothetical protein